MRRVWMEQCPPGGCLSGPLISDGAVASRTWAQHFGEKNMSPCQKPSNDQPPCHQRAPQTTPRGQTGAERGEKNHNLPPNDCLPLPLQHSSQHSSLCLGGVQGGGAWRRRLHTCPARPGAAAARTGSRPPPPPPAPGGRSPPAAPVAPAGARARPPPGRGGGRPALRSRAPRAPSIGRRGSRGLLGWGGRRRRARCTGGFAACLSGPHRC